MAVPNIFVAGATLPAASLNANFAAVSPVLVGNASANLTAPALVYVTASFGVSYANAATGVAAIGFISTSATTGNPTSASLQGVISGLSGLVGGPVYLDPTTPGGVTQTPPASGSGYYAQVVGYAISATQMLFNPGPMNGPL